MFAHLRSMITSTPERPLDRRDLYKKYLETRNYVSSKAGAIHHVYPPEVQATMEAIPSLRAEGFLGASDVNVSHLPQEHLEEWLGSIGIERTKN